MTYQDLWDVMIVLKGKFITVNSNIRKTEPALINNLMMQPKDPGKQKSSQLKANTREK